MNAYLSNSNTSNLQRGLAPKASWGGRMIALRSRMNGRGECIGSTCENANDMKGPFETNIFDHCTGCEWESEAVDSRVYCADSICKASTRRESPRQYGNAGKVYEAYPHVNQRVLRQVKMPGLGSKGCGDEASTQ